MYQLQLDVGQLGVQQGVMGRGLRAK